MLGFETKQFGFKIHVLNHYTQLSPINHELTHIVYNKEKNNKTTCYAQQSEMI